MTRTRSMVASSNSNVSRTLKSATKIPTKPKTSKYFTSTARKERNEVLSSSKKIVTKNEIVERTESFQPITDRTFHPDSKVQVHTLLLGTHPSVKSLAKSQYYGHPMNTFWWIAGDNLGFRRDTGISKSSGKPYKLSKDLLYPSASIIPYEEQLQTLTSHGFALWDILQSCKRKGSLDTDIKEEIPNNIREFCDHHPSIQRIVLCNGSSSVVFFNRHFKDWWLSSDKLQPGRNKESIQAFRSLENMKKKQNDRTTTQNDISDGDDDIKDRREEEEYDNVTANQDHNKIECICGIGVSPAAAKFTYVQKRDFYTKFCYEPGLEDHRCLNGWIKNETAE